MFVVRTLQVAGIRCVTVDTGALMDDTSIHTVRGSNTCTDN